MSKHDQPFEPLFAPRIKPEQPVKATPVNWFERIAVHMPPKVSPEHEEAGFGEAPETGTRKVSFPSVEDLAANHRLRSQRAVEEPAEVVAMRAQAARAAEEILAEARAGAAEIEQQARELGYREGHSLGYAAGDASAHAKVLRIAEEEREAFREDLNAFILHIEAERQRAWDEMEPQIITLVFDLAKKVIKQEIEVSRTVALSVIQHALRRVVDSGSLRIRVHPDDLQTVRGHREDLLALVDGARHVEIIDDRRVSPGGCVLETPAGNIDANIETQLTEVEKTLNVASAYREGQKE